MCYQESAGQCACSQIRVGRDGVIMVSSVGGIGRKATRELFSPLNDPKTLSHRYGFMEVGGCKDVVFLLLGKIKRRYRLYCYCTASILQ